MGDGALPSPLSTNDSDHSRSKIAPKTHRPSLTTHILHNLQSPAPSQHSAQHTVRQAQNAHHPAADSASSARLSARRTRSSSDEQSEYTIVRCTGRTYGRVGRSFAAPTYGRVRGTAHVTMEKTLLLDHAVLTRSSVANKLVSTISADRPPRVAESCRRKCAVPHAL